MKKPKAPKDCEALKRQKAIALHYASIALDQEQLEADAIAEQQTKQDFGIDY